MKSLTSIVVTYGQAPWILENCLSAYARQTSGDWNMILLHDGSITDQDSQTRASAIKTRRIVEKYQREGFDIEYIESEKRYNDWGHSLRAIGLEKATGTFVHWNNGDNIVLPPFVEVMLGGGFCDNMDIVHCDILHNYPINGKEPYNVLESRLMLNCIDMANFIIRTDIAKKVGFNHRNFAADGLFIEDVKTQIPTLRQRKLYQCLVVHC